ncbi:ZIP family zinc transporter [Pseudomonas sp. TE3786]
MPQSLTLQAGLWGWLAASSLLVGAAIGAYVQLPKKLLAAIMAYGSGVLIAALCFEQIPDAEELGGPLPTLLGLAAGGVVFVLASKGLDRLQGKANATALLGVLIAAGAFLDGIPESLGLGLGLLDGGKVSMVMLVAIFLSNLPEGLASAAGMRAGGTRRLYIFLLWGSIVLLSGFAAMAGPGLFAGVDAMWLAFALGFSSGAVLCMLVDTLIPEAFASTQAWTGLITLAGFMTALALHHAT